MMTMNLHLIKGKLVKTTTAISLAIDWMANTPRNTHSSSMCSIRNMY